jgi:hypothetical protein
MWDHPDFQKPLFSLGFPMNFIAFISWEGGRVAIILDFNLAWNVERTGFTFIKLKIPRTNSSIRIFQPII